MAGIADKISRLPPERQQEIEDYIDFLLLRYPPRSEQEKVPDLLISPLISPGPSTPAKPIILADEIPFRSAPDILPGYRDPGEKMQPDGKEEGATVSPMRSGKKKDLETGKRIVDWID